MEGWGEALQSRREIGLEGVVVIIEIMWIWFLELGRSEIHNGLIWFKSFAV